MSSPAPAGTPPNVEPTPSPETPAPVTPAPVVSTDAPPVREQEGFKAGMLAERAKRQELERKLAAIDAEREAAKQAELAEQGKHQELADLARQEAEQAKQEAQRARRDVVLARRGIDEKDSGYAHYAYSQLPEDGRPPFAEWVDAERKEGGALHRFVTEPHKPTGTRATGKTSEPIPADVMADAKRRKQRGGALYADLTVEQLARDIMANRAKTT